MRGWILDVYPDYERDHMVCWIKTEDSVEKIVDRRFFPTFYVYGSRKSLMSLADVISVQKLRDVSFQRKKIRLGWDGESEVLSITPWRYKDVKMLAKTIDAQGGYRDFQLYNVDIRLAQRYLVERGIFPMAYVDVGKEFILLDEQWAIEYPLPELKFVQLGIRVRSPTKIKKFRNPIEAIKVGERVFRDDNERELLRGLVEEIGLIDPDVVYTKDGDSFLFPYLYHRAEVNGILDEVQLGRERQSSKPERAGRSFFSYGQIKYKPPFYTLRGRLHIDTSNSFLHMESGLKGLIELSRISCIPVQTLSKLSPGTAISAMQVNQALREGYIVIWKKNLPEDFKTAMDLMITDRGGFIYEPVVGVHDKILEVDFTSLYPSIMVRYNISPETVKCPCCPDSKIRVPEIGYNICEKQIGLITKVLRPIIQRRMVYKRQARKGDLKCKERSDILKWLLVTCLDGETLVPYEQDGKVRIRPIAEIIDKYLPREGVLWVNDGLQVFGLTRGLAPAKIPVRGVFKFKSPRKILRLRLKQGHELWVTKDHPSYILERERLNVKRADELERGDYIPIMTERSRRGVLTFSRILSIEEVFPRMPFVYCFEVDQGLPGFLVEGNILTHNCFGFTGYKNARYGRIECHESITAYGREILLRSTEIAERHGYRVLHGIVDSLWLEGRGDQKALAEHLRNDIGIPVEIEGIYKWIVFLPCRTMQVGAMNRYYGLFENGKMKIRGVEARRNDSPEIVKRAQLEMLGILSKAENSYEFRRMIPEALGALRVWVDRVMDGDVDVNDLIFTTRISQELEGYAHFGNQVAALTQLKEYGVTVNPGEVVRYLLVDSESRDAFQRLRIAELVEDGDEYDRKKYAEHLLKAGESLFQPFGYDFERVKKECG